MDIVEELRFTDEMTFSGIQTWHHKLFAKYAMIAIAHSKNNTNIVNSYIAEMERLCKIIHTKWETIKDCDRKIDLRIMSERTYELLEIAKNMVPKNM